MRWIAIRVLLLQSLTAVCLPAVTPAVADQLNPAASGNCAGGEHLTHTFASGASWSLCATLDPVHALELTALEYQAPGDRLRPVMQRLNLAQILVHHHDQTRANAQFGTLIDGTTGLGGAALRPFSNATCRGTRVTVASQPDLLCEQIRPTGILAKYAQRRALQGEEWQLSTQSQRGSLLWRVSLLLGEDGRLSPTVHLSGNVSPDTAATVLVSWRMAMALDTDQPDTVEEFDFTLNPAAGNRRSMGVRSLKTETLRSVERERFRIWRVLDPDGAGYYLDPANSGFAYTGKTLNWARFDLAITRDKPCERHALYNRPTSSPDADGCGNDLDDFVNGESLIGTNPVLWYNLTRPFVATREDAPVIASVEFRFDLLPFDWTLTSPFEALP